MGLDNPQKLPDKQWLIKVLGGFQPEHEIFRKDYLPPVKEMTMAEKVVDNQDNFLVIYQNSIRREISKYNQD